MAIAALPPHPVWLLGEQHDAPAHQSLQKEMVQALATQGRLAALVIEMAEAGRDTAGLGRDAAETSVREALGWTAERNNGGWPWDTYRGAIMTAVRAGVPVHGGNLPRQRQREVMTDATLDRTLDPDSLAAQQSLVRDGHCGLLPESQIAPMTRIQLARDRSLAEQTQQLVRPGKTVLLIAGNEHVRRDLGVPRHLDPALPLLVLQARSRPQTPSVTDGRVRGHAQADHIWLTEPVPERDYCGELRRQLGR